MKYALLKIPPAPFVWPGDIGNTFGEIFSSIDYTLNIRIEKANLSNWLMAEEDLNDFNEWFCLNRKPVAGRHFLGYT